MGMDSRSAPRKIAQTICPHSFREVVSLARDIPLRFEVNQRERCRFCGKERWHVEAIEPHPSRDKEQLVRELQWPGCEIVVEDWIPRKGGEQND